MVKEHSEWQNIFYSEFEQLWEKSSDLGKYTRMGKTQTHCFGWFAGRR